MQTRTLPIPDGLVGERADAAIAKLLGFSRSFATEVIEAGGVTVDERAIGKSDRLPAGGWLEIQWRPKEAPTVVAEPVDDLIIVFQDDHIVVVDKPVGAAAHPTVGWDGPTVLGGLAAMGVILSTSGAAERQGVVHRLDAGTSGLMVLAKSELAYAELKRAFHDREVDKVYHTVVEGRLDPLEGTIDAPVGRHPGSRWKFAVVTEGKRAITHYETLEAFPSGSLVEVHLETGRTHQIRVHMAAQRHPCVGDTMYGADPTLAARLGLTRQWLHAVRLGFRHPSTGEHVEFESRYPDDLRRALDILTA
ncbi:MAG: RluA family pseudouridine synthase [Cryobacterium sp.]|nr:RluA family pseudouridine synthase [Cryobacterium sp.]